MHPLCLYSVARNTRTHTHTGLTKLLDSQKPATCFDYYKKETLAAAVQKCSCKYFLFYILMISPMMATVICRNM